MYCGKKVATPAGRFRFAMRRRQTYAVFCSRRCNLVMVAEEGERWKRAKIYA